MHAPPHFPLDLRIRRLGASATLAINERSNALIAEGRRIYKLGFGQSPFPVPTSVVAALRDTAHVKDYLPVRGLMELRQAVARHCNAREAIDCEATQVLIGPGSKELMFLLQLVFYGDILIPSPAWVSYAPQAELSGRRVVLLPGKNTNGWRITPEALDQICRHDPSRARLLILNSPSNPTGLCYDQDTLPELAEVAAKYRLIVLSDEIYGELNYRGEHTSMARYYPEGTIISSGLSKWCGAGGWRLGTFILPANMGWLTDAMATAASETFTSASAPIQYAATTAYSDSDEIAEYVRRQRRILQALGTWVAARLRQAHVHCPNPQGGFYVFPDFTHHRATLAQRGIHTSPQLCERLLEDTGVALLPGQAFARPGDELSARLAFVDFAGDRVLDALAPTSTTDQTEVTTDMPRNIPPNIVDESFLHKYCANVCDAIDALVSWLSTGAATAAGLCILIASAIMAGGCSPSTETPPASEQSAPSTTSKSAGANDQAAQTTKPGAAAASSADADMQRKLQEQIITAKPGAVITIPAGTFALTRTLTVSGKDGITIKGAGMDKTILNFAGQNSGAEGIKVTANGFTIEDLTIADTKGDGLKIEKSKGVTIRRVKVLWTRGPHKDNGAYGLYPVQCEEVLIEESVAIAASDAGIYVGQSKNIIVRNNQAEKNVAGIEIENSTFADVTGNTVIGNTGGILVFDLPDLPMQGGKNTRIYDNEIRANNEANFAAAGNMVAKVPAGTGIMVLANDNVEIFDNRISEHKTTNIAIVSYFVTEEEIKDPRYDPYPEGIYIHGNTMSSSGDNPSPGAAMQSIKLMLALRLKLGTPFPDILWDGIIDDAKLKDGKVTPERRICVGDNGDITFANIDAANDFKNIDRTLKRHACELPRLDSVTLGT